MPPEQEAEVVTEEPQSTVLHDQDCCLAGESECEHQPRRASLRA
jgi:hypothetical protein